MTYRISSFPWWSFAPLLLLLTVGYLAVFSTPSLLMSNALTLDLLITIPLVYYIAIRKKPISKLTVFTVVITGLAVGYFLLPEGNRPILDFVLNYVAPLIELSLFFYVLLKIWQFRQSLRTHQSPDFLETLQVVLARTKLPPVIKSVLATELAMLYYFFIQWKPRETGFSYHKTNGIIALLGVGVFLIMVETSVLHILITRWSNLAAWVLSGISLYTALQLLSHMKACLLRPIRIEKGLLKIRHGLMGDLTTSLSNLVGVSRISLGKGLTAPNIGLGRDFNSPNLHFVLKNPETLIGLYGTKKTISEFTVCIDDPEAFIEVLNNQQAEWTL